MIHATKGIILRNVKYGETSVILTVFTEIFGVQSYMINGARTSGKTSSKAAMLQPANILDLNVYHSDLKNLQRVKDYSRHVLYKSIHTDIIKNCVAMYMVELLQKCLKQPENNADLFDFTEDALQYLDVAGISVTANFPLYFALHLAEFFGFKLQDNYTESRSILDLQEGSFTDKIPEHRLFLEEKQSFAVSQILKARHPDELGEIKLNKNIRQDLLQALQLYYALHISDFGTMKTLPVLHTILSN